jgi:hypothetical protein
MASDEDSDPEVVVDDSEDYANSNAHANTTKSTRTSGRAKSSKSYVLDDDDDDEVEIIDDDVSDGSVEYNASKKKTAAPAKGKAASSSSTSAKPMAAPTNRSNFRRILQIIPIVRCRRQLRPLNRLLLPVEHFHRRFSAQREQVKLNEIFMMSHFFPIFISNSC